MSKWSGKPLIQSGHCVDLLFSTTNPCRSSNRTIGRSRMFPSTRAKCSNTQTFPVALAPPKLDPYQEDILMPATPSLVQSPASSISSAASIASLSLDCSGWTTQASDIGQPLQWKFSGNLDTWFSSVALAPDVVVYSVHTRKYSC